MGNMPNRWGGRALAVVAAAMMGTLGFFVGRTLGDKLAFGFTFDWYVSPTPAAYPLSTGLTYAAIAAAVGALFTVAILTGPSALLARWRLKANRHPPPPYANPIGLDLHGGRPGFLLPGFTALLAAPPFPSTSAQSTPTTSAPASTTTLAVASPIPDAAPTTTTRFAS